LRASLYGDNFNAYIDNVEVRVMDATNYSTVMCAAFVILWVRSCSWNDGIVGPLPRSYVIQAYTMPSAIALMVSGPAYRVHLLELSSYPVRNDTTQRPIGLKWGLVQGRFHATIPLWCPTLLAAIVAAGLGVRTVRFSLRALLLATTLIAVLLGLIVALAR
jgi:hypothetical protein